MPQMQAYTSLVTGRVTRREKAAPARVEQRRLPLPCHRPPPPWCARRTSAAAAPPGPAAVPPHGGARSNRRWPLRADPISAMRGQGSVWGGDRWPGRRAGGLLPARAQPLAGWPWGGQAGPGAWPAGPGASQAGPGAAPRPPAGDGAVSTPVNGSPQARRSPGRAAGAALASGTSAPAMIFENQQHLLVEDEAGSGPAGRPGRPLGHLTRRGGPDQRGEQPLRDGGGTALGLRLRGAAQPSSPIMSTVASDSSSEH